MATTKPNKSAAIQVVLPEDSFQSLKQYAEANDLYMSDIVRLALERYFEDTDNPLTFDVDRGGFRGRKSKTDSQN